MEQTRTAAPDRLIEALKQTQTQITQMQAAQDRHFWRPLRPGRAR
jgi:hypothetical protein